MSEQEKKRRFQDIETVLLIVGKGKALFRVHKNLLIEKSGFFKEAFETMRFKKGSEKTMELVDEDEETFDLFVQWLYRGEQSLPKLVGLEEDDTDVMLSVKLYVLADTRDVKDLQHELMDRLVKAINREPDYAPSVTVVSYVYGSFTRDDSAIRTLVADWAVWKNGAGWSRGELLQVPAFAADLVCSLKDLLKVCLESSKSRKFPRKGGDYFD